MSTETGSDLVPTEPIDRSVAARMRLYRQRRSRELRCVRVPIAPAEIDGLVAKGYLSPGKRNDREAISLAISDCLVDALVLARR